MTDRFLHETRTPSMIVGCDPGKSGALARLDHAGNLIAVADMPVVGTIISAHLLDEIVHNWIDPLADAPYGTAVIEDVHAMPKQGVSSSFSFGRALGVAEGVLAGNSLSLRYVSPAKWKKALGLSADKGVSRRRAIELWPDHRKAFERVKDDGRAEAALLAWWWWKHEAGR